MATSQVLPKNRSGGGNGVSRTNTRILLNRRLVSSRHVSRMEDDGDTLDIIHFQENKHTILSNFEEWIRLSTDNKITSKNSWNFALIDYFHDLNVIKDGDKINFQRASATLDGCVKIYLSRVESAATETGKLLSGLSNKQDDTDEAQVEQEGVEGREVGEDEDDEDEDGNKKKQRKINRIVESTLVNFETLKIKKLDQELNIDPLFKKALSEFDEGGAKSLLLNTLNIDKSGRVIFDATTKPSVTHQENNNIIDKSDKNIDFTKIEKLLVLPNINDYTICPSINQFKNAIQDFSKAKGILEGFTNKYNDEIPQNLPDLDIPEFDYDNDNKDDQEPEIPDFNYQENSDSDGINNFNKSYLQQIFDPENEPEPDKSLHVTNNPQILDRDLMAYFDDKMKVNWKGPEHWKVSALKNSKNFTSETANKSTNKSLSVEPQAKKKNQNVIINFFEKDDMNHEDKLFAEPKNPAVIMKKTSNGESPDLPDDIRYNSSRLINLFQKPQISIIFSSHKKNFQKNGLNNQLTDENFFAEQYKEQEEQDETERFAHSIHQAEFEEFNNDFGGDDGYNGIDFNDVLEGDLKDKPKDDDDDNRNALFKRRNEFINFSRVAKRVDIKLLKDNIWNTIQSVKSESPPIDSTDLDERQSTPSADTKTKFADIVSSVSKLYEVEARKELSTSFCFICLLHLANEHSLTINANESNDDLEIIGF